MTSISNSDDIINSKELMSEIEELESELDEKEGEIAEIEEEIENLKENEDMTSEEMDEVIGLEEDLLKLKKELQIIKDELEELQDFNDEFEGYCPDWQYGVAIIRESYIDVYLKDELEDCRYIPKDFPDWIEIDWDATFDNMKADWTEGEFDGITYYAR